MISSKKRSSSFWMSLLIIAGSVITLVTYPSAAENYRYAEEFESYYTDWFAVTGTGYLVILILLAACALCLPALRKFRRESSWLGRIPIEGAAAAVLLLLMMQSFAEQLCTSYVLASGGIKASLVVLHFLIYSGLYGVWLTAVSVLLQIIDLGPVRLIQERSFLYPNFSRVIRWVKKGMKVLIQSVRTVDLSEKSDRWILRLVCLNFVILMACCMMWYFGVFALILYSIVLFFLLRRYWMKVKDNYHALLGMTAQMAQGNLQVELPEQLGMFEPLGEELAKVKAGFRKAVEEEARSQNMKTELITNVSHDLKTPLTAIITYVNLLKDGAATAEEQKQYIDILDRKSLRLKKLIEDLFEISKAASGNIRIEKQQVDLSEMVKQAAMEQEDRMKAAQLDLRIRTPEERVLLMLDAEKTYRVLENLLVNVSKYALPGTRAWVVLTADTDEICLTVKNISADELSEDCSALTERFVRGDKARNTEGSGLGLAIVESFVRLQGGTFGIVTDGDLFKAILRFPTEPG